MRIQNICYDEKLRCFRFTLDDESELLVSYPAYNDLNLRVDDCLDEEKRELLRIEDLTNRAFFVACRYAVYQPRTKKEVRDRLLRERFPKDISESVLEMLAAQRLLDDTAYACRYAQDQSRIKHWSRRQIESRLREKGLCGAPLKEALVEVTDAQEADNVAFLYEKKYAQVPLNDVKSFQRVASALLRRGFSTELVLSFLKQKRRETSDEYD